MNQWVRLVPTINEYDTVMRVWEKEKTFTEGITVLTQFNEEVCSRYGEECVTSGST